jgi:hypothetical protein
LLPENFTLIPAESECAANLLQFAHGFAKLLRAAVVDCGNARSTRNTEARGCDSSSRESQDQHAFVF